MGKHSNSNSRKLNSGGSASGSSNRNQKKKQQQKISKSNEKSCFRVDNGRAMKAKKNKAFVKFNKSKSQAKNAQDISRLNKNLDSIRNTTRTFQKKSPQFINPIAKANNDFEKTTEDLNAAIDKFTSL